MNYLNILDRAGNVSIQIATTATSGYVQGIARCMWAKCKGFSINADLVTELVRGSYYIEVVTNVSPFDCIDIS